MKTQYNQKEINYVYMYIYTNYNEVLSHTSQNSHHQKIYKQQELEMVWRKGNPLAL